MLAVQPLDLVHPADDRRAVGVVDEERGRHGLGELRRRVGLDPHAALLQHHVALGRRPPPRRGRGRSCGRPRSPSWSRGARGRRAGNRRCSRSEVKAFSWPPSADTTLENSPAGWRFVPLNIRCSRKCAMPDWPTGSSAEPLRYQTMWVTTGTRRSGTTTTSSPLSSVKDATSGPPPSVRPNGAASVRRRGGAGRIRHRTNPRVLRAAAPAPQIETGGSNILRPARDRRGRGASQARAQAQRRAACSRQIGARIGLVRSDRRTLEAGLHPHGRACGSPSAARSGGRAPAPPSRERRRPCLRPSARSWLGMDAGGRRGRCRRGA